MADVVRTVLRLHHRAQQEGVEGFLRGLSFHCLEEAVEHRGRQLVARRQLEPVRPRQRRKRLQLLPVRLVMDPVDGGQPAHLEEARHPLVGGEHELLHQPVGIVARAAHDLRHPPLLIEDDLRLGQIEVDASARLPLPRELLRELVGDLQILGERPQLGIGVTG